MADTPETWSVCSWVIRIAVSETGSMPAVFSRSSVSLRLKPASIRRRVRSVATRVALPELEEARTETWTMTSLLSLNDNPLNGYALQWIHTHMKARVYVSFKTTVLDPQGQTIQSALNGLGHKIVTGVRQGKFFEIEIKPGIAREDAAREMDQVARDVLANPVMEDYRVEFLD